MTVYGMLTEAVFLLELRSADVDGAIGELVKLVASHVEADDLPAVLAELKERERLRRAAVDGEFAILHAVTPRVERLGLAFGRSPSGLLFEGTDGPTVHFVCILLVPPHERSHGFRALNGLAFLLRDPMVRTQLLWADTVDEVLAICRQAEGGRWLPFAVWLKGRVAAALRPSAAPGTASGEGA